MNNIQTRDIIYSGGYSTKKKKVFFTHKMIKDQLSKDDLLLLLSEGFQDCSYSNDEVASFYHPVSGQKDSNGNYHDPLVIMVIYDYCDDAQEFVITFEIYDENEDEIYFSDDMADIIGIYKTIVQQRRK